ncbi:MAG: DUF4062 domain-containing protein [Deltaproteobacteria bacterium]|nr:DUF4062 domain-containing protein [Deltaproteobacteria bacterium]
MKTLRHCDSEDLEPSDGINGLVRVFVSSTFKGMNEERDILAKIVFPHLKRFCEKRGLVFAHVDLRWGITDDQVKEGDMLRICFSEIDKCNIFLGLLGNCYGTITEVSEDLIRRESWLAEYCNASVAELEIRYAALNRQAKETMVFTCFREARSDDPEPLLKLRKAIKDSTLPIPKEYRNPREIDSILFEDVAKAIAERFPDLTYMTRHAREVAAHDRFAAIRQQLSIPLQDALVRLTHHVESKDAPMTVVGEIGSGKTTLLANWTRLHACKHPDDVIVKRFIGSTPASLDWRQMVNGLIVELKQELFEPDASIASEFKETPEFIWSTFLSTLSEIPSHRRVILVLDAIDRLDNHDQAHVLPWLPATPPPHVRIILSTRPGRTSEVIRKREWPVLDMRLLTLEERTRLGRKVLELYGKDRDSRVRSRVSEEPLASNPLYLALVLNSIIVYGKHSMLVERLEDILKARSVRKLIDKTLDDSIRQLIDDPQERPGWVGDTLGLLWASQRGLDESEIKQLLSQPEQPFPDLYWSWLRETIDPLLIDYDGRYSLLPEVRDYVERRILVDDDRRRHYFRQLGTFFSEIDDIERRTAEMPWQLAGAEEWSSLMEWLRNPKNFARLFQRTGNAVLSLWSLLEQQGFSIVRCYGTGPVSTDPKHFSKIASLYYSSGRLNESLQVWKCLDEYYEAENDEGGSVMARTGKLTAMEALGLRIDYESELGRLQVKTKRIDNRVLNARLKCHRARELRGEGDLSLALELQEQAEHMCLETGDVLGYCESLNGRGITLFHQKRFHEANMKFQLAETISDGIGSLTGLQEAIGNQAIVACELEELELGRRLILKAEKICRRGCLWGHLQRQLYNLVRLCDAMNDKKGAEAALQRLEEIPVSE